MYVLQLGEATLYAASLELMEACIKKLTALKVFENQVRYLMGTYIHMLYYELLSPPQILASAMQPSREELEWPLSQMDREVGISFSSDFNFSLAALLYKGAESLVAIMSSCALFSVTLSALRQANNYVHLWAVLFCTTRPLLRGPILSTQAVVPQCIMCSYYAHA